MPHFRPSWEAAKLCTLNLVCITWQPARTAEINNKWEAAKWCTLDLVCFTWGPHEDRNWNKTRTWEIFEIIEIIEFVIDKRYSTTFNNFNRPSWEAAKWFSVHQKWCTLNLVYILNLVCITWQPPSRADWNYWSYLISAYYLTKNNIMLKISIISIIAQVRFVFHFDPHAGP